MTKREAAIAREAKKAKTNERKDYCAICLTKELTEARKKGQVEARYQPTIPFDTRAFLLSCADTPTDALDLSRSAAVGPGALRWLARGVLLAVPAEGGANARMDAVSGVQGSGRMD